MKILRDFKGRCGSECGPCLSSSSRVESVSSSQALSRLTCQHMGRAKKKMHIELGPSQPLSADSWGANAELRPFQILFHPTLFFLGKVMGKALELWFFFLTFIPGANLSPSQCLTLD